MTIQQKYLAVAGIVGTCPLCYNNFRINESIVILSNEQSQEEEPEEVYVHPRCAGALDRMTPEEQAEQFEECISWIGGYPGDWYAAYHLPKLWRSSQEKGIL